MKRILIAAVLVAGSVVPLPARAATVTVFVSNFRFCNTPVCAVNEDVTVDKGDTVQWMWTDAACTAIEPLGCGHSVTKAGSFDSGVESPDPQTWTTPFFSRTFGSTGTFEYVCTVHAANLGMRASVIVR